MDGTHSRRNLIINYEQYYDLILADKQILPCNKVEWDRRATKSIMEQARQYFNSGLFGI